MTNISNNITTDVATARFIQAMIKILAGEALESAGASRSLPHSNQDPNTTLQHMASLSIEEIIRARGNTERHLEVLACHLKTLVGNGHPQDAKLTAWINHQFRTKFKTILLLDAAKNKILITMESLPSSPPTPRECTMEEELLPFSFPSFSNYPSPSTPAEVVMTDMTIHIKIDDGRDPQYDTCATTFLQDAALGIQEHTHSPGSTQTSNKATTESEKEPDEDWRDNPYLPMELTSNIWNNDRCDQETPSTPRCGIQEELEETFILAVKTLSASLTPDSNTLEDCQCNQCGNEMTQSKISTAAAKCWVFCWSAVMVTSAVPCQPTTSV